MNQFLLSLTQTLNLTLTPKGRDIFSAGYPPGAFLRGAKSFTENLRFRKKKYGKFNEFDFFFWGGVIIGLASGIYRLF